MSSVPTNKLLFSLRVLSRGVSSSNSNWARWRVSASGNWIKMVINGVENWSPDMIPVALERKFDEKKDVIPPGIHRPHMFKIYQYWGVDG